MWTQCPFEDTDETQLQLKQDDVPPYPELYYPSETSLLVSLWGAPIWNALEKNSEKQSIHKAPLFIMAVSSALHGAAFSPPLLPQKSYLLCLVNCSEILRKIQISANRCLYNKKYILRWFADFFMSAFNKAKYKNSFNMCWRLIHGELEFSVRMGALSDSDSSSASYYYLINFKRRSLVHFGRANEMFLPLCNNLKCWNILLNTSLFQYLSWDAYSRNGELYH